MKYSYFSEDKKPSCVDIKCPPAQICVLGPGGLPTCKCLVKCTKKFETGPVCGMNGIEYPDLCDLKNDECAKGDYILVKKYGSCGRKSKPLLLFNVTYRRSFFHVSICYCRFSSITLTALSEKRAGFWVYW